MRKLKNKNKIVPQKIVLQNNLNKMADTKVAINQMEQAVKSERETAKAKGQTQQKKEKS